jgi:hydrogenase-4 component E
VGQFLDTLLVLIMLLDFVALGISRMRALIRACALQSVLLASLPFWIHEPSLHLALICAGTMLIKGLLIPLLLLRAIREVTIRREIDPLIGFVASVLLGALGAGLALLFSDQLPLLDEHARARLVPCSLTTVFTGFLILTTRQQAVIQVIGYMLLENGIFLFGLLLLEAMPLLVELGVLLDLLVGVFVMGIILHQIQRTFASSTATSLASLKG